MSRTSQVPAWVTVVVALVIVAGGIALGLAATSTAPGTAVSTLQSVPRLVGLAPAAAVRELQAAGLPYRFEPRLPAFGPRPLPGTVEAQSPPANSQVPPGTVVILYRPPSSAPLLPLRR
jgi:beta-lactam-binding protein with PASTA domain